MKRSYADGSYAACIRSALYFFSFSPFFFFLLSQHQVFNYVHYVMTEDGYTDLEREELKEASLNSLKVGTKENYLVRGCGAGRQLPTLLTPPPPPPISNFALQFRSYPLRNFI